MQDPPADTRQDVSTSTSVGLQLKQELKRGKEIKLNRSDNLYSEF